MIPYEKQDKLLAATTHRQGEYLLTKSRVVTNVARNSLVLQNLRRDEYNPRESIESLVVMAGD
jgi:hypothetical protein